MSSSESRKKISRGSSTSSRQARSWSSYASPSASAFWKIVGFEVTPTTASSSIIRFSSPVSTSGRESVSNQTDWPRSLSSCRRDLLTFHAPFHLGHLFEALRIPRLLRVEPRADERGDELARERRPHDLRPEAEHVHVVVLDALVRAVGVVADRGADAEDLAGGDRGTNARAADEDPALGLALPDHLAELAGLVGVVAAERGGVGSEVADLVPRERIEHRPPEMDAAVVERHRDLHRTSTRAIFPSSNVKRIGRIRPSARTRAIAWPSWRSSIASSSTAGSSPSSANPGETSLKKSLIACACLTPHAPGALSRVRPRCRRCTPAARARSSRAPRRRSGRGRSSH